MVHGDYAEYKPLFIKTAWEYMRDLETGIDALQNNPLNEQALETLHISAHSLKSQSLVMGYEQFAHTAHELEKLFYFLKNGGVQLESEEFLKVRGVIQSMKEVLTHISSEDNESDMSGEKHIIQEINMKRGETR